MTVSPSMTFIDGALPAEPATVPAGNQASHPPAQTPELTPEIRANIEKFRQALQLGMGQVVLATMNLPRYRNQTLADLTHLFVAPLLRDRVAIARRAAKPADDAATEETVVGFAIWATVSDAVDAKITEQIKANVFPVRLGPDDWASGDTVWLLDVVAHDRQQATSVLANFRQLAGSRTVKIAPLVTRLIDPDVVAKLREAAAAGAPEFSRHDAACNQARDRSNSIEAPGAKYASGSH